MNDFFMMTSCKLCPRECKVNRLSQETGFCGWDFLPSVARSALHFWEEPCISGNRGSGTLFFSGCNLACVYCQNHEISQQKQGKTISIERLSQLFLEQQARKAHNLNLVTPTHFAPVILQALKQAKTLGLSIPVVYNTNAYEKIETLKKFHGWVQVYLPDFKYLNPDLAERYSHARNYPEIALKAIHEMVHQTGSPCFDDQGILTRGVIIRHLVLPNQEEESRKTLEFLFREFGHQVYFSIMNQFTPTHLCGKYPELNRILTQTEYDRVIDFCADMGMEQAFIQEENASGNHYVPSFNLEGVDPV